MGAHSKFGGSIIEVISHCPGYVNAVKDFPDESTEAAEKGTAYHECAEYCERLGFDAADVKGEVFNGFECDDYMVEAVQIYLNHTRSLKVKHTDFKKWVEGQVTLSSIADDVFGTADYALFAPSDRTLYISDLKGGFVHVDVEGLQTPYYAIGFLDTYNLWFTVDKVVCTIVQPRTPHAEGDVRTREYNIAEMQQFRDRIVEAVRKARDVNAERIPGPWCKYCKAAALCRKRMERTVFLSTLIGTKADLTNDELAEIMAEIPTIKKNLETLSDYANTLARGGSSFKGFKLVKPILRAKVKDEQKFIAAVKESKPNFDVRELYNPGRMKGKTVLRKELGNMVDDHFDTPEGNAELVPLSNPRAAVNNDASGIFAPIKD